MAKVGTGYVEIQADLTALGAPLSRKIEERLRGLSATVAAKVKVDVDRSELSRFAGGTGKLGDDIRKQIGTIKPEVKPELDEGRLALIREKIRIAAAGIKAKVSIDVDRGVLGSLGSAFTGIAAGVSGLLSRIPVIGGLFQGLTSAFGTTAIGAAAATAAIFSLVGVLAALAASLGAAIAGLGALTIALAGALGPAAIVVFAAISRMVAIVKAVKDQHNNAATATRGLAGANDQLTAASDAVAAAQANVREQTTAAYRAWHDSIETVKDDLRGVKDAQLGIDDANLSLREAEQALKDFKAQGATGLDAVFKKFTDVNVDFSGLKGALAAAGAGGSALSGDDSLKLERLILSVREAKQHEKDATNSLHDANVKLGRDRSAEKGFLEKGIKAYKPYTDALKQVTSAQRSLASAQRASAAAADTSAKAYKDLTGPERRFATALAGIGTAFKKAFTPVMGALLPGVTRGLQTFGRALSDPRISHALVITGRALGDTFAGVAKALTNPEARQGFEAFAKVGARIVKLFGTRVFTDFALIIGRLGLVTLPYLVKFLDRVADWFDKLEKGSRNTKSLGDHVGHLVDVFDTWVTLIGKAGGALLDLAGKLEPFGTGLIKTLSDPSNGFADKLAQVFEFAAPKIAEAFAHAAPRAAKAFIKAFLEMDGWAKLLTLTFILAKLGAFSGAGSAAAGLFVSGLQKAVVGPLKKVLARAGAQAGAEAGLAAAGTEGIASKASLGRFRAAGTIAGRAFRFALLAAITFGLAKAISDAAKGNKGVLNPFGGKTSRPATPKELARAYGDNAGDLVGHGFAVNDAQTIVKQGYAQVSTLLRHGYTRKQAEELLKRLKIGHAAGGLIPGWGGGDQVPALLERGEFVVQKNAAKRAGLDTLNQINRGEKPGPRIGEQHIHIQTPAGAMPDGRFVAAQIAREMAARA